MNQTIPLNSPTLAGHVLDAVAKVTGISKEKMLSSSRLWPLVEARMLVILMMHRLGCIDGTIALALHRNRSTICSSRGKAWAQLEYSKSFRDKYLKIKDIIDNI